MFNDLLNKYGISAYKLSKETKIPYTTISELNTNKRTIDKCNTINLFKISKFLNLSMDDVYKISVSKVPSIPISFKGVFWDTNFEQLDFYKNKCFIITRLITKGGYLGFKWVFDNYDKYDLIETTKKSRAWDHISANYMSFIFNISKNDMEYYKWNENEWR